MGPTSSELRWKILVRIGHKNNKLFQYLISRHQNRTTQQVDMKNHWQSDLDSIKKMENIHTKKQMVIPGNLPSQLRVLDSSQQLHAPLFLASSYCSTPILFLKTPRKTLPFLPQCCLPPFSSVSRICLLNDLYCSHIFCHLFSRHLFCPTPSTASKSEVDSLWPLRMWHVALWDSDTWLKMRSAKSNREKVTHA